MRLLTSNARHLIADAGLIALSVVVAILLARTGLIIDIVDNTRESELVGSFVSGIFFTSSFTVAPAGTVLVEISRVNGVLLTALFGAFGAMLGDLVIFRFAKNRFVEHLSGYVREIGGTERLRRFFTRPSTRWVSIAIGTLVLASPLPDELGVAILGANRLDGRLMLPLAFVANAAGIAAICLAAQAL